MLSLFKKRIHNDPYFGDMIYQYGKWRGTITLTGQPTVLALGGNKSRPDETMLQLAIQLPAEYPSLMPSIQNALYEHYEPYREHVLEELRAVPNDSSLWNWVRLVQVTVEPQSGEDVIELSYEVQWDEEHTLGVHIINWKMVGLNGSLPPE